MHSNRAKGAMHWADVRPRVSHPADQLKLYGALVILLLLTGLAIAGPWGLFAWRESTVALQERKAEIAILEERRAALQNRVDLLHPDHADPDLAGELVKRNLGVVHADDVVVTLEE
ncbi:MAG: septum formation initiator [Erythrobacter sp.]|jgi:cell division protein FtsB|nr:septum formation initiator [Erythrobacter sp.]